MTYETLKYERKNKIVYITLNRPKVLNAVNSQMRSELLAAFSEFDLDEDAWICILHGAGRCFTAGGDVKQRFDLPKEERARRMAVRRHPEGNLGHTANWKPVIAAIHSHCLGAGIDIAVECDLIVASEDARFGIPEIKLGIPPMTLWGKLTWFMPSKLSTEMALTGESVAASEFYRLGLINRLVPVGQHLQAAEELAQQILKVPPLAVRASVRMSRYPWVSKVAESCLYFDALRLWLTEDFAEAARAFSEKREPIFHGR